MGCDVKMQDMEASKCCNAELIDVGDIATFNTCRKCYQPCQAIPYPAWICRPCGQQHGKKPKGSIGSWHLGTCGVCGQSASVTQPRDFGHLKEWPIKEKK